MSDDDDTPADHDITRGVQPRRWSWWIVVSMFFHMFYELWLAVSTFAFNLSLATCAHAEFRRERAEMREQAGVELERITGGE